MGTGVSTGSPVTTWQDQSGNGNNALAYSGSAVLTASVFGSAPGVIFGSPVTLRVPYNSSFQLTAMTAAIVLQYATGASTWQNFFSRRVGPATTVSWQLGFGPTSGAQYNEFNGVRSLYDPASLSNGDQRILLMTGDGSNTAIYRNNTVVISDASAFYNNPGITNDISIGDSALGNGEFFYGYIGAIMMWDHILTSPERDQVVAYLNGAFGVP